jgi:hypothetical protein
VAQGELVNKAMEGFEGTPLHRVIGWVFDTELRNSIGNYELTQDGSQALILHPSGRTMTSDEAWRFLMLDQTFHQGTLNAISKLITFPDPDHWRFLREYGVVALDWHVLKEGSVETILNQLWCFAELDADGSWLDTTEFTICEFAGNALDGRRAVRFGSGGFLDVPDTSGLEALQSRLEEEPWLLVTRYPVAPNLGLGYPRYGDEFEIVGVPEEHFVHYAGAGTIDPSNLPPKHSA